MGPRWPLHFEVVSAARIRRPRKKLAIAVLALTPFLLTGCAPEPEPEPVQLTITEAGGAYLDAVCPVNDSWDEVDLAVDQLRLSLDAGGDQDVAMERLTVALKGLGSSSVQGAKALDDGDQLWPADSARLIGEVADSLRADQKEAKRVLTLTPQKAADVTWPDTAASVAAAAAAREALGLPADSALACADRPAPTTKPDATTKPGSSEETKP